VGCAGQHRSIYGVGYCGISVCSNHALTQVNPIRISRVFFIVHDSFVFDAY
jgi:hypothetical protein